MTLGENARAVLGTWGRPPDEAATFALVLAAVIVLVIGLGRGRAILGLGEHPLPRRLFLWIAGLAAALLSIAYIATYLRGGPRIIDATTYFMQGRALSHGDFSWSVVDPSGSFRGRFLLYREDGAGEGTMGGIFPPGYPLLLAIGFKIGAPMVVGPLLAVAIVIVTYRLARLLAEDALGPKTRPEIIEAIGRAAALVSIVCGALRYHTADTMAHGATALGIAIALGAALRGRFGWAGLALGGVVATRPVSAIGIGLVVLFLVWTSGARGRALRRAALGLLPGVLFLIVAQHAVTGHWGLSSQKLYYALADGPADCFRWGFGKGVGCLAEHGDFVDANLKNGYGPLQALVTTARRLRMHLLDVANLEPLALLLLVPLLRKYRSRAAVVALAIVPLHVLAYAGFYFDGNYPGGGARFFADLLPVEHALLVLAVVRLFGASKIGRSGYALVALMLLGFGVHAAFGHLQLANRDGGRPMFEPDVLTRQNINAGLVFVDTDHGFALGHDAFVNPKNGILVARFRNDDRDRVLYDRLDHPPSFIYRFDPNPPASTPPNAAPPVITPWAPPALGDPARYEAESEWPPLAQEGGFAIPAMGDACASEGGLVPHRVLALTPVPVEGKASATISVPVPQSGKYRITLRVTQNVKVPHVTSRVPGKPPKGSITIGPETWTWTDIDTGGACADLPAREVVLTAPRANIVIGTQGGTVSLDRVMMKKLP